MFLCKTCGTQFADSGESPPASCPICEDERQYLPPEGQQWTTLDRVRAKREADIREQEPRLTGIGMQPQFAIGQRALLVESPSGNVLWDCLPLLDGHASFVHDRGGLALIAISHPHYYTTMVEWGRAFGAPVHLHAADREWVMRPDPVIRFWEGEQLVLGDGLTLVRCGGHFEGGTVLHWARGAEGRGALLSGDIVQVVPDRRHVSFMRSYPNLIPLDAPHVRRIVDALEPLAFDRIYGAWWDLHIERDAKRAIESSAARYLAAIGAPAVDVTRSRAATR